MTGPDLPYARPYWDEEEAAALTATLATGFWTNGGQVMAFERELVRLTGAPTVTVSSGTAALLAVLHVLGDGVAGPRLMVSSTLTFAGAAASALLTGWDVALCDVDPDDLTISVAALDELLDRVAPHYARVVVVPVHYAGHTCDMAGVLAAARRHSAVVVEDACHAIGGRYTDTDLPVGSWPGSAAACFSFHPTKPVASGEGGAVASRDEDVVAAVRLLRNHNMAPVTDAGTAGDQAPWPYSVAAPGFNLRLSEFNAAVGAVQARRADRSRRARAHLAALYHDALAGVPHVRAVPAVRRAHSAHHLFPVVFDVAALGIAKRDLLAAFHRRGVRCQVHYTPLHRLPAFAARTATLSGPLPVADRVFPGLLSLPLWRGMTEADVARVVGVVTSVALGTPEGSNA